MFSIRKALKQDLSISTLVLIISLIGLLSVFSTTFYFDDSITINFTKQILYSIVGSTMYFIISGIEVDWLKQKGIHVIIFVGNISVLTMLLLQGEVIASTKRWIDIGPVSIQPAEFTKLVIILNTAYIITQISSEQIDKVLGKLFGKSLLINIRKFSTYQLITRAVISLFLLIPSTFLILEQPSLGNAIITVLLWLIMVLSLSKSSASIYYYLLLLILIVNISIGLFSIDFVDSVTMFIINLVVIIFFLIVGYLYREKLNIGLGLIIIIILTGISAGQVYNFTWENILDDYQKDRITSFINPESDPLGSGWQVSRAKLAITSAPFPFGYGFLQGPQTYTKQLPFPYTDFIYASMIEQFGIVIAYTILGLYMALLLRIINIGKSNKNEFEKLLIVGIIGLFILNITINIGMNIGIMPVTGVPLPLISYGGSSIMVYMIALGIIQMIYTSNIDSSQNYEKLGLQN